MVGKKEYLDMWLIRLGINTVLQRFYARYPIQMLAHLFIALNFWVDIKNNPLLLCNIQLVKKMLKLQRLFYLGAVTFYNCDFTGVVPQNVPKQK
jgi:hypothetical protein